MPRSMLALAILALLAAPFAGRGLARAEDAPSAAQPGDRVSFLTDVTQAFEKAAAQRKPVMICINSKKVDGGREEPAAKGLREIVYLDPRVVTKSRSFICVFLTSEGSSDDYGELRVRFGIDGLIVSPQHIFAHPDHKQGQPPLARKEYWPHGKGEGAVKALLDMMDEALRSFGAREGTPQTRGDGGAATPPPPDATDAPAAPQAADERAKWVQQLIGIVREGGVLKRGDALRLLVSNDRDGDCFEPLIALLEEFKEEKAKLEVVNDVVHVLGVPGLEKAALAIHDLLKHKDDALRANAAVTLEYIGSKESVDALSARVQREKSDVIAGHMYRALGRCGAGDSKVRALLVKKVKGAKSEWATYGPIVGLAYFAKDAKAARDVEKLLASVGPPSFGRRGGWTNNMKRALLAWTLSEIQDPKSGAFMQKEMLEPLKNVQSPWLTPVVEYYEAIARKCDGDAEADAAIQAGIQRTLEFSGGTAEITDAARKDRDRSKFEPKADWELEGRTFGGGGPGGDGKGR